MVVGERHSPSARAGIRVPTVTTDGLFHSCDTSGIRTPRLRRNVTAVGSLFRWFSDRRFARGAQTSNRVGCADPPHRRRLRGDGDGGIHRAAAPPQALRRPPRHVPVCPPPPALPPLPPTVPGAALLPRAVRGAGPVEACPPSRAVWHKQHPPSRALLPPPPSSTSQHAILRPRRFLSVFFCVWFVREWTEWGGGAEKGIPVIRSSLH